MKYLVIGHGEQVFEDPLEAFIEQLPYLIIEEGRMPPIAVLNSIFITGEFNSGMSGIVRWDPFQITKEQYMHIFKTLKQKYNLKTYAVPKYVKTYQDWLEWEEQVDKGPFPDDYFKIQKEISELGRKRDTAYASGDLAQARSGGCSKFCVNVSHSIMCCSNRPSKWMAVG